MKILRILAVAAISSFVLLASWLRISPAAEKAIPETLPFVPAPDPAARQNPWSEAAQSSTYAQATAADPHFDDKTLWPALTGKEQYTQTTWPKAFGKTLP